ncbi:TPA: hypothetical protein ACKP8A_004438 [Stenotrophomonas maltophilia]
MGEVPLLGLYFGHLGKALEAAHLYGNALGRHVQRLDADMLGHVQHYFASWWPPPR